MTTEELMFLPGNAVALYEAFCEAMERDIPETCRTVTKTQISLRCGVMYGCVSLPRRKAERENGWLIVTFGLDRAVEDPRIRQCSEPYPHRWTHHVLLTSPEEIDAQLMGWLQAAAAFAAAK